jgi:hypothetical protein
MPQRAGMWMRRSVLLCGAMATVAFAQDRPAGTGRYEVLVFAPAGPATVLGAARLVVRDGGWPQLGKDVLFADVNTKGLATIIKDGPKGKARLVYEALNRRSFTQRDAQAEAASLASGGQGAPGTYYLFALLDVAPGQDGASNAFYDTRHLPDMLAVPGMVWGLRARLVTAATEGADAPGYLAVYQFRSYDLAATIAEINRRLKAGIVRALPENVAGKDAMIFYAAPAGW